MHCVASNRRLTAFVGLPIKTHVERKSRFQGRFCPSQRVYIPDTIVSRRFAQKVVAMFVQNHNKIIIEIVLTKAKNWCILLSERKKTTRQKGMVRVHKPLRSQRVRLRDMRKLPNRTLAMVGSQLTVVGGRKFLELRKSTVDAKPTTSKQNNKGWTFVHPFLIDYSLYSRSDTYTYSHEMI